MDTPWKIRTDRAAEIAADARKALDYAVEAYDAAYAKAAATNFASADAELALAYAAKAYEDAVSRASAAEKAAKAAKAARAQKADAE